MSLLLLFNFSEAEPEPEPEVEFHPVSRYQVDDIGFVEAARIARQNKMLIAMTVSMITSGVMQ